MPTKPVPELFGFLTRQLVAISCEGITISVARTAPSGILVTCAASLSRLLGIRRRCLRRLRNGKRERSTNYCRRGNSPQDLEIHLVISVDRNE